MMRRIIFALIISVSTVTAGISAAAMPMPLELSPDAPDRHVVVAGDTLWSIASKFLKDPYRWPELWRMNADQVRNPQRIHPGQVLILQRSANGDPYLKLGNLVRLTPQVRSEAIPQEIPAIPPNIIEPFLAQPLVISDSDFDHAARIIATQENRVYTATGDMIYASGNADPTIKRWHVFRPGRPLRDPDTNEVLGLEAVFAGSARTAGEIKDVLPLEVTNVRQEIGRGDYIVPAPALEIMNYVPHMPTQDINARVISIYGGVGEAAVNSVISISRGKNEGLEVGHVLALYRTGPTVSNRFEDDKTKSYTLPDERYGLVFVFRVFDRVSYGLVTAAQRPVMQGDRLLKP